MRRDTGRRPAPRQLVVPRLLRTGVRPDVRRRIRRDGATGDRNRGSARWSWIRAAPRPEVDRRGPPERADHAHAARRRGGPRPGAAGVVVLAALLGRHLPCDAAHAEGGHVTDAEIREVAERTADAFAWDSYRPGRYTADTLRRFLESELRQRGAVGLAGQVADLVAGTFGGDEPSGAGVHYTQTANGRPACEGYMREAIPDDEPGSPDRRLTTCADCLAVREEPTDE